MEGKMHQCLKIPEKCFKIPGENRFAPVTSTKPVWASYLNRNRYAPNITTNTQVSSYHPYSAYLMQRQCQFHRLYVVLTLIGNPYMTWQWVCVTHFEPASKVNICLKHSNVINSIGCFLILSSYLRLQCQSHRGSSAPVHTQWRHRHLWRNLGDMLPEE